MQENANIVNSTHRHGCLKFIHIPKTAGQTIEDIGFQRAGLKWGMRDESLMCKDFGACRGGPCSIPYPCDNFNRTCCFFGLDKTNTLFSARKNECSSWHAPPGADAFLVSQYASCDTFCVVRDPLMRFISQYHWHYLYWKPEVSLPPNVSICGNNSASLFPSCD